MFLIRIQEEYEYGKDYKMETIKQGILLSLMTFAFWGILYPQFSLAKETYNYMEEKKNPKQDFVAILNAQAGELQFRSKLWELWKERAKKEN